MPTPRRAGFPVRRRFNADRAHLVGGRALFAGRVPSRLAVEGHDVKRQTPAPKVYGPDASKRAAAIAKRDAALLADKYISRDGVSKERKPDT